MLQCISKRVSDLIDPDSVEVVIQDAREWVRQFKKEIPKVS
jgi:hypothetical protein